MGGRNAGKAQCASHSITWLRRAGLTYITRNSLAPRLCRPPSLVSKIMTIRGSGRTDGSMPSPSFLLTCIVLLAGFPLAGSPSISRGPAAPGRAPGADASRLALLGRCEKARDYSHLSRDEPTHRRTHTVRGSFFPFRSSSRCADAVAVLAWPISDGREAY